MAISIIIPAFNEEKNISCLYQDLIPVLNSFKQEYEILFIDDGSNDKTYEEMLKLRNNDKNIKIIKFKKNFGQTAAWSAGFKYASGQLIVVMDADLQNDPQDIPKLIARLNEGYDIVSGWRFKRNDSISKKIFSRLANRLRRYLTGEKIHDSGCSLKIYKKECVQNLNLRGEMHRYITAILSWKGYKVGEIKVKHRHRKYETTKYSFSRIFRGMMDLLLITFWQRYSARPIHFFGISGFIMAFFGFITGTFSIYLRIFKAIDLSDTFLPNVAVFLVLMGINLLAFGILADISIKNYYKDEDPFLIEKIVE